MSIVEKEKKEEMSLRTNLRGKSELEFHDSEFKQLEDRLVRASSTFSDWTIGGDKDTQINAPLNKMHENW